MNLTPKKAQELKDWYWKHGVQRRDAYALTRGGWYDRVLRTMRDLLAVNAANRKPTMALWGPSQSGKSTMLQCFIDYGVTEDGKGGALGWDPEVPARFCGDNKDHTVAVLNPFNQGADASGCVTRYHLCKEVPYTRYPVKLHFATTAEILLYLAIGYQSETTAVITNQKKEEERVHLDEQVVRELIATSTGKKGDSATAPKGQQVNLDNFNLLVDMCDVIETLIDMGEERYFNLRKNWAPLRATILNNDALVSSRDALLKFAAGLFWDGWKNLTELFSRLEGKRAQLAKLFDGKDIYCSLELTALMLNISAAENYEISRNVQRLVDSCGVTTLSDTDVAICENGDNRLFANCGSPAIEFALVQSLVSLIEVPLKDDVMAQGNQEAYELLKYADLVDFPGVANEEAGAKRLTDEQLSFTWTNDQGKRPLYGFTQVMKRGKTASIVVRYSRDLNVDAFSLLVRMPAGSQYPAKPGQLMNGILSWVKAMTGTSCISLPRNKELPINLVLTFSATLINLVNGGGMNDTGLNGVFSKLRTMADLSNSECVTTFCVNYPQFPDGKFHDDTVEGKEAAISKILQDKYFGEQFKGTTDSLRAMAGLAPDDDFGGRLYFFRHVKEQLQKSKRITLLEERGRKLADTLAASLSEAMPSRGNGNEERIRDLQAIIDAVTNEKRFYSTDEIGMEVRRFMNVDPEKIEQPPVAVTSQDTLRKYLERQITQWAENAKSAQMQECMGFQSIEHRTRFISYLTTQRHLRNQPAWLATVIESASGNNLELKELRRLVSTYLCNALFHPVSKKSTEAECIREITQNLGESLEHGDSPKASAYYRPIILPFLDSLERLIKDDGTDRPAQPGDRELIAISEDSSNA